MILLAAQSTPVQSAVDILGAFSVIALIIGGVISVALTVLAVLMPWFVWRTKRYAKACYRELVRQGAQRSAAARDGNGAADALERLSIH